jgi:hypothetical protein
MAARAARSQTPADDRRLSAVPRRSGSRFDEESLAAIRA